MEPARSLGELLLRQADARPDQPFLHTADRSWSYREFAEEALRVVGGLRSIGLERGDVLGIWTANRPEFLLAWFGAALAGIVLNPVNPQFTADELSYVLTDSGARVLVYAGDERVVHDAREHCPELRALIALDGGAGIGFDELLAAPPAEPADVDPHDLASLIYTSGTTGRPKGVMLEHRNSIWDAAAYTEIVPYGPGEAALTVLPLFHVNAQLVTTLVPLTVGGTTVLAPRFSASEFWPLVERFQPVFVSVVPTILAILLETADEFGVPERTSLRAVVVGAAPLPVEIFRRFEERFNLHLIEGYGLTECACVVSANPYYGHRKIGSIGLPLRGQELRVVDDTGDDVVAGEVGEILIRGPNVMRGYWRNEEATAETLRDGWLHTGDLGRVDEDGYFFVVDRKKEMIIRGGENIYPREIEEVLHTHPDIADAAVIGIPDPIRGEEVLAAIVRRDPALGEEELRAWLEPRLAAYKHPKQIAFVASLPRTPTGKVQKQVLKEEMPALLDTAAVTSEPMPPT